MFIQNSAHLASIVKNRQDRGECIVFTNGVFDLLHIGHVRYLQDARDLGQALIVAVNSDASVRKLKGPTRPLVPDMERAEILDSLRCVDYVILFASDTPIPLLKELQAALYVKGGDYSVETLPETPVVREYGGDIRILKFVENRSTSRLVEQIRDTA